MSTSRDIERARDRMVAHHLADRGIANPAILRAFSLVPREHFVPVELANHAYDDRPLPIGSGQTISQPYVVALTVEALGLGSRDRVLEIGTGSGYAAAILSLLVDSVYSVERIPELAHGARTRLAALGYDNVKVVTGDGNQGLAEFAPYDGIAVAAGAAEVPPALLDQLAAGGRLVIPVGQQHSNQMLTRIVRTGDRFDHEPLCPVRFVPLISGEPASNS